MKTRLLLKTVFLMRGFGELHGLGLDEEREWRIRALLPQASGLLSVHAVLPGGPAANYLEPGDIVRLRSDIMRESSFNLAVAAAVHQRRPGIRFSYSRSRLG